MAPSLNSRASSGGPLPLQNFAVLQEAAEWFAVLGDDRVSAADRLSWQTWHDSSPAHREAWRRVEAVSAQLGSLPGKPANDALALRGNRRRHISRALVLLCAGAAIGGISLGVPPVRRYLASLGADYRTGVGEIRRVELADQSQLWLNTASAADVSYTEKLRRIHLLAGEILVASQPDAQLPPRPLVVDVGAGRLRALGTRFTVRIDDRSTHLAVLEGAVEVLPARGGATRVVPAGQQLEFGSDWLSDTSPADADHAAWSKNVLMADGTTLGEFVAELSRYRRGYLGCAPEVAALRLVGVYPLDDTDRILAALEASLPVRVQRTLPWWVSIEAR